MVVLKNPYAPATEKQLWRLHQLTGEDTRTWHMSMQEASDKIATLEAQHLGVNNINSDQNGYDFIGKQPFDEAKVTIITGDQGGGKSITAVARVVDRYDNDCVSIFCRDVLRVNDCRVLSYDRQSRMAKIKRNGQIDLLRIPQSYKLYSPIRIFCNFHLWGLPYVYCPSFSHVLKWLKQGIIINGFLIVDEYYIGGNARDGMRELGKELVKQSFQYRKMQLEVEIITPLARLIDWTARMIPTERIECTYNKVTHEVTLSIKKKGVKASKEVTYDSTYYRRFYWTNERINA